MLKRISGGQKVKLQAQKGARPISNQLSSSHSSTMTSRVVLLPSSNSRGFNHAAPSSPRSQLVRARARRRYRRDLTKGIAKPAQYLSLKQQELRFTQLPSRLLHTGRFSKDMSNNGLDHNGMASNKNSLKHQRLVGVINSLEKEEKDRARLHGLVTCAEEFKESQNMRCKCIGVESLGWSYNPFLLLYPFMIFSLQLALHTLSLLRCTRLCSTAFPTLTVVTVFVALLLQG